MLVGRGGVNKECFGDVSELIRVHRIIIRMQTHASKITILFLLLLLIFWVIFDNLFYFNVIHDQIYFKKSMIIKKWVVASAGLTRGHRLTRTTATLQQFNIWTLQNVSLRSRIAYQVYIDAAYGMFFFYTNLLAAYEQPIIITGPFNEHANDQSPHGIQTINCLTSQSIDWHDNLTNRRLFYVPANQLTVVLPYYRNHTRCSLFDRMNLLPHLIDRHYCQ
jgi:hypothetical protein